MNKGLLASINSDDPAYFGGYMNANYLAITEALNLSEEELAKFAKVSFQTSFLSDEEKADKVKLVEEYLASS